MSLSLLQRVTQRALHSQQADQFSASQLDKPPGRCVVTSAEEREHSTTIPSMREELGKRKEKRGKIDGKRRKTLALPEEEGMPQRVLMKERLVPHSFEETSETKEDKCK